MVSSNARIGGKHVLRGGHFVDLVVSSRHPLTEDELLAIGRLAAREDSRPVSVRRAGTLLVSGITVSIGPKEVAPCPNTSP